MKFNQEICGSASPLKIIFMWAPLLIFITPRIFLLTLLCECWNIFNQWCFMERVVLITVRILSLSGVIQFSSWLLCKWRAILQTFGVPAFLRSWLIHQIGHVSSFLPSTVLISVSTTQGKHFVLQCVTRTWNPVMLAESLKNLARAFLFQKKFMPFEVNLWHGRPQKFFYVFVYKSLFTPARGIKCTSVDGKRLYEPETLLI